MPGNRHRTINAYRPPIGPCLICQVPPPDFLFTFGPLHGTHSSALGLPSGASRSAYSAIKQARTLMSG
jgi:hypothetical protein